MKISTILLWIFLFLNVGSVNSKMESLSASNVGNDMNNGVFICNSKNSKKYHYKENCRGLKNCKASIKELSLEEAKNKRRSLCGWED